VSKRSYELSCSNSLRKNAFCESSPLVSPEVSSHAGWSPAVPLPFHPCLHPQAHHQIPRLHLPVAPRCNTRCGYCEREVSDGLVSTIAPGLSSAILLPKQALAKTRGFLSRWGSDVVVGIAGPGEPLANEETLQSLRLIRHEYPGLVLCLCTNGLNLPDYCDELRTLGVQHLTVTINGFDPAVVAAIQPTVTKSGQIYVGKQAAELLIKNQIEGVQAAVESGIVVKINTVVIPEINGDHIVSIARAVKDLGALVFNPIPLIPRGSFKHMRAPDSTFLGELRLNCSRHITVFHHCRQCRADAEGIPGKEPVR
jgi:nitrogen fixation protein NifB